MYGTVGPTVVGGPARSNYTLDGLPPVTFTAPLTINNIYQLLYYQSPTLDDGEHSLIVTDIGDQSTLWVDYLLYT